MQIGDQVIFYTHEASDDTHSAIDKLAFVTSVIDENIIDVVVFPPGGPVTFERVSLWDPNWNERTQGPRPVGLNYWRPVGQEPPDFKAKPGRVVR